MLCEMSVIYFKSLDLDVDIDQSEQGWGTYLQILNNMFG